MTHFQERHMRISHWKKIMVGFSDEAVADYQKHADAFFCHLISPTLAARGVQGPCLPRVSPTVAARGVQGPCLPWVRFSPTVAARGLQGPCLPRVRISPTVAARGVQGPCLPWVSSGINGHRLTVDTVLVFQVTWAHTSGIDARVYKSIQTYRVWTAINKSVISATRNSVSIRPPVARGKRDEHAEKELLFRETLHRTYAPRVIVCDNSCQLHRYAMNRDPHFFKMTVFLVDGFPYRGHIGCSLGYCMDSYTALNIQSINSQVNEQANSGLIRIQPQLVYMSPSNFMFHASLFLALKNMRVCEDREVNVGCGADTTACISVKMQTYHAS
ncbi:hypothetical protein Bbelb_283940 [Branchiostoma belcheri]|nr:hypothetical protein Bbelb_283940 [Branchiostoma belcheri]